MADFVGGLISGIDSGLIIEKMVQLQSRPIALIEQRQKALTTQVSALGDLASKLAALGKAAGSLASDGVRSVKVSSSNASFAATSSSSALPGNYEIAVQQLATSARTLSSGFTDPNAQVRAGTLQIEVQGESFEVEIAEGASFADVAAAITASGAPVSAMVISDGRQSYLSITSRKSGHALDAAPDSALVITQSTTGTEGQTLFGEDPLNPAASVEVRASAQNALFTIDGLAIERTSNEIDDLLPGVHLSLKSVSDPAGESLVLSEDREGTQARMKEFVDAFNAVASLLRRQTSANEVSAGPLAGDSAARSLEQDLQALLIHVVPGGSLGSLADAGLKIERNGTLTLDEATLNTALSRDPTALDALFAGEGGIGAAIDAVVEKYNHKDTGILVGRQTGLNDTIKRLGDDIEAKKLHIEAFTRNLIRQFTALEETLARLNSTKTYLDQLDIAREKK